MLLAGAAQYDGPELKKSRFLVLSENCRIVMSSVGDEAPVADVLATVVTAAPVARWLPARPSRNTCSDWLALPSLGPSAGDLWADPSTACFMTTERQMGARQRAPAASRGSFQLPPLALCGSGQQYPFRAPQRVQRIAFEIVSSGVSISSRCCRARSWGSIMVLWR